MASCAWCGGLETRITPRIGVFQASWHPKTSNLPLKALQKPGTGSLHLLRTSTSLRRRDRGPLTVSKRHVLVRTRASTDKEVYQGVYGPWSVEDSDKIEVWLYRAGLNVASFSLLLASLPALFPSLPFSPPLDPVFWSGTLGLGLSLILIHIYVTPIKRTLQSMWLAGVLGALVLSSSALSSSGVGEREASSLVQYVVDHPLAIWAVGPMFASLTGLVFKEGLCYGKLEAALLVLVIPSLLLGHLSGVLSADIERPLLGIWVTLSLVFSLRKFTQPLKDDIGDKSVFTFQAMSPEEQERVLRSMQTVESER